MQSRAFFRITTFDALSLCDSSGTLSRRRMKQFFSSLRRCRSITLWVRRLSSSSSVSVELRDEWRWYRDEEDDDDEEELREEWWKRNELSLPLERLLDEEEDGGGGEAGQGAA